ncbi:MAG: glucose-1-phosphate thymidylyltransferase RfbA [Actinobacteria bacterium]|nr:glucose-1-phosphate thymidylyltransferase RfbA [Actinomycetota bacterium]
MAKVEHRGILLAGGKGTRLYPLTASVSKHLMAVFDKPMIYYPLTTLMMAGIREILLISTPEDLPRYRALLGDGSPWGVRLEYAEQAAPRGIAEALVIGEEFTGDLPAMLALGDNLIYGRYDFLRMAIDGDPEDAVIFAYRVDDPSSYGVIDFGTGGEVLGIEEKPANPRSHWAVPGLYIYPAGAAAEARRLAPSGRGEMEITDLNRRYLEQGRLRAHKMGRGTAWFDTGTPQDLLEAANFIEAIQRRQGLIIGCPEEVAYHQGFIDHDQLTARIEELPECAYREYLARVAEDLA